MREDESGSIALILEDLSLEDIAAIESGSLRRTLREWLVRPGANPVSSAGFQSSI
ncbi:hypothetical protein [Planobispora takensis]|uniref:FXSXX-COOH protein n=1 Tax=Planobispora takensis TaxID=1367882 RepID=A0A8J3TAM6_9ACTN|nr:hypothetical protein [Planobispora takensis]GII03919.1 hypothetical protein Pta02_59270 [Planobispora takensis]